MTPEERRANNLEYMRNRRKSPEFKAQEAKNRHEYNKTPEAKAKRSKYRSQPEVHEKELEAAREYRSKFVNKERNRLTMENKRKDPAFLAQEREYAAVRLATQPEPIRAAGRRSALKRRRFLNLLKMERPCYDCGGMFPPAVTDWDHLPQFEKKFNVGAQQKSFSLEACIDEINKCQLVCSNCHRLRTQARKQKKGEE